MATTRAVTVWHDALHQPNEARIEQQIEWWASIGWRLVERREASWRWWQWRETRGRTILTFERGSEKEVQK